MCDLDPKVKVIDEKAGICDGVPSTAALVYICNHKKSFYSCRVATRHVFSRSRNCQGILKKRQILGKCEGILEKKVFVPLFISSFSLK